MAQGPLGDRRKTSRRGSPVANDPDVRIARARWELSEAEKVAKQNQLALLEAEHAAGNKTKENRERGAAMEKEDKLRHEALARWEVMLQRLANEAAWVPTVDTPKVSDNICQYAHQLFKGVNDFSCAAGGTAWRCA